MEGCCEQGNVPFGSIQVGKLLRSCKTGSISRRAQLHGVGMLVGPALYLAVDTWLSCHITVSTITFDG
jgi:hypothetical protein